MKQDLQLYSELGCRIFCFREVAQVATLVDLENLPVKRNRTNGCLVRPSQFMFSDPLCSVQFLDFGIGASSLSLWYLKPMDIKATNGVSSILPELLWACCTTRLFASCAHIRNPGLRRQITDLKTTIWREWCDESAHLCSKQCRSQPKNGGLVLIEI